MQNSAFLRRGKFGMLFFFRRFFFWLMFLICIRLLVGYFIAAFLSAAAAACLRAAASASDDLNVLPVLCVIFFLLFYFCYLRLYPVAASLERTYLMDTSTRRLPAACLLFLVFDLARLYIAAKSYARLMRLH